MIQSRDRRYEIPVGQHDSFNIPGGAGGVKDRRGVRLVYHDVVCGTGDLRLKHGEKMGRIEEDNGDTRREFLGSLRGGEGDGGFTESDLVSQLGGRGERVGRRDDDAEREEGEVEDGYVERGRGEDECDVVLGEGGAEGFEGG